MGAEDTGVDFQVHAASSPPTEPPSSPEDFSSKFSLSLPHPSIKYFRFKVGSSISQVVNVSSFNSALHDIEGEKLLWSVKKEMHPVCAVKLTVLYTRHSNLFSHQTSQTGTYEPLLMPSI